MITKEALIKLVDDLNRIRRVPGQRLEKSAPIGPAGLPSAATNQDGTVEGKYWDDNLTDPGILHGVTGTGNGPIIGG